MALQLMGTVTKNGLDEWTDAETGEIKSMYKFEIEGVSMMVDDDTKREELPAKGENAIASVSTFRSKKKALIMLLLKATKIEMPSMFPPTPQTIIA